MLLEAKCRSYKGVVRLNEKKLGAIIVLLVASIAPAMILGGLVANALTPPQTCRPCEESLAVRHLQIHETPTNLNASLIISSCTDRAMAINVLRLSNITQSDSPGIAVSINGTYIDCTASPLFTVGAGDTAIVNMIVPYTSCPYALSMLRNANVISITVLTKQAMYYNECDTSGL